MAGLLDLYPRARQSAFRPHEAPGVLACARCASEQWGMPAVWRAVNGYADPPRLEARPLRRVLLEAPGACCSECGMSFWDQLPRPDESPRRGAR